MTESTALRWAGLRSEIWLLWPRLLAVRHYANLDFCAVHAESWSVFALFLLLRKGNWWDGGERKAAKELA